MGSGPIWLSRVTCYGREDRLAQCSFRQPLGYYSCTHDIDGGVRCLGSSCTEGDVRLVSGASPVQGRVEACKDNVWGTLCRTYFEVADARVTCRQLGLPSDGNLCLI